MAKPTHRSRKRASLRPAPPLIVKVQRSLSTGDGVRSILIYDEDSRSIQLEGPETDIPAEVLAELEAKLGPGWLKFYCYAAINEDGMIDIGFGEHAPEQPW